MRLYKSKLPRDRSRAMAAAHIGPSVHMDPTFWTPVRLYEKVDRTGDFKQYLEEYGVGPVPASSLF